MPNSAQNIKFYYGDSSSAYPPQSIDTNGLYLIKNKGVYAGSETIIDTSLFPFNNENIFTVTFTVNASTGIITADKTFTELNNAWTAKKLIVGKMVSSDTNTGQWGDSTLDTIKPNLLSCTYDGSKAPTFFFSNISATNDTIWSLDLIYEDNGTISVYDAATKQISLAGHTHHTLTHAQANTTKLYITGVTGIINQQPKYDENVYLETTAGHLHATQFNGVLNGSITSSTTATTQSAGDNSTKVATTQFVTTAISNNTLKYTVKAVSSNAVSFTSSSKMLPNTVYVCGSVNSTTNMFTFELVNSLSIANNSLNSDIAMMWSSRQAAITNSKVVPTYQIVFRCGSSGASITLPSSVVWRDGSAPAASDLINNWCELTIMNDIATIIII